MAQGYLPVKPAWTMFRYALDRREELAERAAQAADHELKGWQ